MDKGSGQGTAPFVAENRLALETSFLGVVQGGRSQEGEPQVVVAVGKVAGRAVNIGPAEVFFVVDVGVEGVPRRFPDLVGLAVELFSAAENATVTFQILQQGLVERGASQGVGSGPGKGVGHPVYGSGQGTQRPPISGFWTDHQDFH